MIVPDGRTDAEKLRELLTETEQTHLDFKERVDLHNKKDELDLIKDIVTMSNRPGGGYILIGVRDNGVPCCPTETIQRRDFDGANIGQKVRAFVESDVHVITAIHEVHGNEIVVIYAQPHSDGLPVPMAKLGQYQDGGRPSVAFRPGDIFVREGASNMQIRHCHWKDILSHHDRLIREQAMTDAQSLIGEFVKHLQPGEGPNNAGATAAPLLLDMNEEAFANAVMANFEAGNDTRIRTFLVQSRNSFARTATSGGDTAPTLDRIAIVAAQSVMYERLDEARLAIKTLRTIYLDQLNGDPSKTIHLLDVLIRVYVIGGLAVRMRQWTIVHDIVQQPVENAPGSGYIYDSWLRHGQVEGSRANLFPKDKSGLLISSARELAAEHPVLRPDVPKAAVMDFTKLEHNDTLLNSLCQFDLAYCLMVAAEGTGNVGGYPSCAAFRQDRANPILDIIATEPGVREAIFPKSTDAQIATAMTEMMKFASTESFNYGRDWFSLPPAAAKFASSTLP